MKVKQIHKNIGVSIEGIDLSRIDNNVFQQIKDLWLEPVSYTHLTLPTT